MSLVRNTPEDGHQIKGFLPGQLWVDDTLYTSNLILLRHHLIPDWAPVDIRSLRKEDLAILLPLKPDLLLIGTGEHQVFPPTVIYAELISRGIGVEIMNTNAACRTWNALISEHRHVAAALFLR